MTPNINDTTKNITGYTTAVVVLSSNTLVLDNPDASGKLMRVTSLYVSNTNLALTREVTVKYYNGENLGGSAFSIASTISIPSDSTLVTISKDAPIYLRENSSLGAMSNVDNDLNIVVSYEEIS